MCSQIRERESMATNSRGRTASIFKFGDFTYDSGSRLLTRSGARLHLSPKAHQLLYLMLVSRPRALSRQDLYDKLWPATFVCETNLAGVVNEIRRVLGDDARAAQFIRTVHGFGYAFDGEVDCADYVPVARATLICGETSYRLYQGENSIGRSPDTDVMLPDSTISRHHAVIIIDDDENAFLIQDLDSTNGTYVDGQEIGRSPVLVARRAQIEFGAVKVSVELERISTTKHMKLKRHVREHLTSV